MRSDWSYGSSLLRSCPIPLSSSKANRTDSSTYISAIPAWSFQHKVQTHTKGPLKQTLCFPIFVPPKGWGRNLWLKHLSLSKLFTQVNLSRSKQKSPFFFFSAKCTAFWSTLLTVTKRTAAWWRGNTWGTNFMCITDKCRAMFFQSSLSGYNLANMV